MGEAQGKAEANNLGGWTQADSGGAAGKVGEGEARGVRMDQKPASHGAIQTTRALEHLGEALKLIREAYARYPRESRL